MAELAAEKEELVAEKAELEARVMGQEGSLEEAKIMNEEKDGNVTQLQNDVETTRKTLK